MLKQSEELKDRVVAKQKEIESKIAQLKAETRSSAREEIQSLQQKLNELQQTAAAGWEKLSEKAVAKINDWLKN